MKWIVPYMALALWTGVATVLQALIAGPLGMWTPDLPLLLLVAAIAHLHRRDAMRIALVSGLARCALTIEPPFAVLCGTFCVALAADGVRRFAELSGAALRASLCAAASFGFGVWLLLVHAARSEASLPAARAVLAEVPMLIPMAATSALTALVAWPLTTRLPGLRALRSRLF